MNNENKQKQTQKIDSFLGRGIIDESLAFKKEMAGRIEEIIARIEQNFDHRLENAILFLAGNGKDENLEDSIGFNWNDSRFGHSLAIYLQSGTRLTLKQAHTALQMMQKYSKTQLEPNGYSLPRTWEEISHQYREREIEINPYLGHMVLQKDEAHDACIAIRYPVNVEIPEIRESLEDDAGIEDGESWPVSSDYWNCCYPFWRAEGLLAYADEDWYVDPDIEAAYYLWQEEQKAGIDSGRISGLFSHSATPSTIDELLALEKEMARRIEEIIARIEQNFDHRLENAILFLAGSGNDENLEDSIGFNERDSRFGHSLARHLQSGTRLTLKQAHTALQMMQKYSKTQLEPNGYSLPRTWEEISHQYRERTITLDPYRGHMVLQRDEKHDTFIAIYFVEEGTIDDYIAERAGIEGWETWYVWSEDSPSGYSYYGYLLLRSEGLLAAAQEGYGDWYVDPDIEAAYYLWQEEQKAGVGSERISASFSRSATASQSASNNTVDPMGDAPLEMVKNVLRPGDYSGVWHGHAVKFSIQQIFPAGEFNGVGEFVGGPHSGIQFGFTGKIGSDGRLTISRDVGIGSQVARDANFEIDGDSIVWQGLAKGVGIGDVGLPFEFRARS
ncbi:MAG: hypothetical protein AAGJ08_04195 [Cyanobacteria bacterium P01_H01_bin.35]